MREAEEGREVCRRNQWVFFLAKKVPRLAPDATQELTRQRSDQVSEEDGHNTLRHKRQTAQLLKIPEMSPWVDHYAAFPLS